MTGKMPFPPPDYSDFPRQQVNPKEDQVDFLFHIRLLIKRTLDDLLKILYIVPVNWNTVIRLIQIPGCGSGGKHSEDFIGAIDGGHFFEPGMLDFKANIFKQ